MITNLTTNLLLFLAAATTLLVDAGNYRQLQRSPHSEIPKYPTFIPYKAPHRKPRGGKVNPKQRVKPKCIPTTSFVPPILDEADGPAGRLTRIVLASQKNGICPTVGSPEYLWWVEEIAWAQRNLHSVLPLSIIDVSFVSSYIFIHSLPAREEKLATFFKEYLPHDVGAETSSGKDTMEGTGIHSKKEPPSFPILTGRIGKIQKSYEKLDSERILLPSGSSRGGGTTRIVDAHAKGKCQEVGAFKKLKPHAKGMTTVLVLVLGRINAMILKEEVGEVWAEKFFESGLIRDHALKYVHCLRQAIASHISDKPGGGSRGWSLLDAALLALEKGTLMDMEINEKSRAKVFERLPFLTPEESEMALEQDDMYTKAIAKVFENDEAWARWKRLVKAAFWMLDQKLKANPAQTVVSVVSKSPYAVDPLMMEIRSHLYALDRLIGVYPRPKISSLEMSMADHPPEAVKKLMSFLGFRLMQMFPEMEIPMEKYFRDLGLMKMTKGWKENVDFLASATKTDAAKKNLSRIFLGQVKKFASNKKVIGTIQGHVRNVHMHRLDKQVEGGAARARRSLEVWRRWLIGTILGHVAYNEYCKVQGCRSSLSNRLMSKVNWALTTMAGPVALTEKLMIAMDKITFLMESYTRSFSDVDQGHHREDDGFAEMAAQLIRKAAWKEQPVKEEKRFDRFVMLLIRLLNDVVESIRNDI